jgi:hypothetical protein
VRTAATLFILISGWLVLTGRLDKSVLAGRVVRIMAVASLLTSAGTFNTYVRDLFLQDIPSSIGSALTGGTTYAPAAQFDALWNATQRMAATVLGEATGYAQIGERIAIRLLMAVSFVGLIVIFLMWVIARVVMGMVIALGPFLIGLYLFDATRPFVDRWVGKLVSLTLVQVSISVMLQMLMTGFSSPLTKSAWFDSLSFRRERLVADGSWTSAGTAGRYVGVLGGDATLCGSRLLRQAADDADRVRVRQVRRDAMCVEVCVAPWPSVAAAGALLPHAAGRLLRRHRQRARSGMALCGQSVAARIPAPRRARARARPFLAYVDGRGLTTGFCSLLHFGSAWR